jgi:hypothetical protein
MRTATTAVLAALAALAGAIVGVSAAPGCYRATEKPEHARRRVGQSARYIVMTHAPPRPRLCWRATLAFGTWRFSA